ncbi:Ubiquitin-protein ligase E3A [Smittium culicis]|uniref:HECT-type E3 ubiquitin transferase n=1 Tax=Smittium culicis TaxID=133412 RepID=A0A1R1Y8J2_9FUNG|nr:Ubiquitin-protein ligase E3A [Smittium culicis]
MVKVGEIGQLKKAMLLGMEFTHFDTVNSTIDSNILANIDPGFSYMTDLSSSTGWKMLGDLKSQIKHRCNPYLLFGVRRENLVTDSMDMLRANLDKIGYPLKVRFVDSGEDGLDMGGIQKEFFNLLLPKVLNPELGLFRYTEATITENNNPTYDSNELEYRVEYSGDKNYVWPNGSCPTSYLEYFEFVGMFLGIAFNNMVLLDNSSVAPLPRQLMDMISIEWPEIKKGMMNWSAEELMDYCSDIFPSLVDGLANLYKYTEDAGSVEDIFCHSFDILLSDPFGSRERKFCFGIGNASNSGINERKETEEVVKYDSQRMVTVDLIENGRNIMVTNDNKNEFIKKYLYFLLVEDAEEHISRMRIGFLKAGSKDSIKRLYNKRSSDNDEICGLYEMIFADNKELDAEEWRRVSRYENGFSDDHETVINFWEIVKGFTKTQKENLLKFATGSSFLPLGGFKNLSFVILKNGGSDSESLPTAQTCFSRLLIPPLKDKDELERRLLVSIGNYYGFGLA